MFNQDFMDALNLLNIYSVYLGLLNISENRQQTAQNDVHAANDEQARYLIEELGKKFDEQNEMLKKIVESLND